MKGVRHSPLSPNLFNKQGLAFHNNLIEAIAQEISCQILDEVRAAKFFTLTIDSAIDISRADQFSLSLRYVTSSGHSRESFIALKELEDGSAV